MMKKILLHPKLLDVQDRRLCLFRFRDGLHTHGKVIARSRELVLAKGALSGPLAQVRTGSIPSQQVHHLAVKLVASKVFVLDVGAFTVEDAERAAQVPKRESPAGFVP